MTKNGSGEKEKSVERKSNLVSSKTGSASPSSENESPVRATAKNGSGEEEKSVERKSNPVSSKIGSAAPSPENVPPVRATAQPKDDRPTWSHSAEFLMSCIAMSVGLGNIWRFPLAAYENGGGAFLVPYIVVLFLVGKPMYYLEMILGQFSGRNSIRVWAISPALTGVGYGQLVATFSIVTYYVSLMALTIFYMVQSFSAELPWSNCREEWGPSCYSAALRMNESFHNTTNKTSSSEFYFTKDVLAQYESIADGIGLPDWRLACCLLASWFGVFLVMMKGVKSTGKASYFMALFPYVIMLTLLVKAVTLEGAMDGIIFFLKPNWHQLYNPQVWYAAVTQVFFSLTVCIGAVIMYSSFNKFSQNLYRDVLIIVSVDTLTSFLAGLTIFGILGNLAHEKRVTNIKDVIGSGGNSLAFISYPDAIAKFDKLPQAFSVLFFLMLWVLGLGSAVSYQSSIVTALSDQFKRYSYWKIALLSCMVTFIPGLLYITPGGQHILNLVDYFGGTFLVLGLALVELIGVSWIYGLENICEDIEFMTGKNVSAYWRWCWGLVTPMIMMFVFLYALGSSDMLHYMNESYPLGASIAGWVLVAFGLLQLPLWALILHTQRQCLALRSFRTLFQPSSGWGPKDTQKYLEWMMFKDQARRKRESLNLGFTSHILHSLNGTYRKVTTPQSN